METLDTNCRELEELSAKVWDLQAKEQQEQDTLSEVLT